MLRWFGEQLKERTGDGDITFKEVSQEMNSPYMCPSFLVTTTVQLRYIRTAHTRIIRAYFAYTRMSIRAHTHVYYSFKIFPRF